MLRDIQCFALDENDEDVEVPCDDLDDILDEDDCGCTALDKDEWEDCMNECEELYQ